MITVIRLSDTAVRVRLYDHCNPPVRHCGSDGKASARVAWRTDCQLLAWSVSVFSLISLFSLFSFIFLSISVCLRFLFQYRLVGLVVRRHLESGRSRVRIPIAPGFFRGRVIPVTSKLALHWLPYQAPGVIGSALGLVGPVSVYCDWVRWKVGSAASISVWQHVKLSEQTRP